MSIFEEYFPQGGFCISDNIDECNTYEVQRPDREFEYADNSDPQAWNTSSGSVDSDETCWVRCGTGKLDFECSNDYHSERWNQESESFIRAQREADRPGPELWGCNGRKYLDVSEAILLKQKKEEREETLAKLLAWVERAKTLSDLNRRYWQYRSKIDAMYKESKVKIEGGFRYWVAGLDAKLTKDQVKKVFEAFRTKRAELS